MTSRERKYHDNKKVFKYFRNMTLALTLEEDIEFWRSVGVAIDNKSDPITVTLEKPLNLYLPPAFK